MPISSRSRCPFHLSTMRLVPLGTSCVQEWGHQPEKSWVPGSSGLCLPCRPRGFPADSKPWPQGRLPTTVATTQHQGLAFLRRAACLVLRLGGLSGTAHAFLFVPLPSSLCLFQTLFFVRKVPGRGAGAAWARDVILTPSAPKKSILL